jgi:hypothetical protein
VVANFLFGTATMQLLLAGAVEGLHDADHATCSGNSPVDWLARLLLLHAVPRLCRRPHQHVQLHFRPASSVICDPIQANMTPNICHDASRPMRATHRYCKPPSGRGTQCMNIKNRHKSS